MTIDTEITAAIADISPNVVEEVRLNSADYADYKATVSKSAKERTSRLNTKELDFGSVPVIEDDKVKAGYMLIIAEGLGAYLKQRSK